MKKTISLFIVILFLLPIIINAETYSEAINKANSILNNEPFKRSYDKYLITGDSIKYNFEGGTNKINTNFSMGGLISKDEYDLSKLNGNTYLFDGVEYWTQTKSDDKVYVVVYNKSNKVKLKSATSDYKTRVVEFVKKATKTTGSGTISDPWAFSPVYKVSVSINEDYAQLTGSSEINVIGNCSDSDCTASFKITPKNGNKYVDNDCGASYDEESEKLVIKNVKRDTNCKVLFASGVHKITLTNANPNVVYLKTNEGYYKDLDLTQTIYKLTTTPTQSGKVFDGYSYGSTEVVNSAGEFNIMSIDKIHEDITLSPKYINSSDIITYKIKYELDGGTNPSDNPTTAKLGEVKRIKNPSKKIIVSFDLGSSGASASSTSNIEKSYTFDGWTFTNFGSNAKFGDDSSSVNNKITSTTKTIKQYFIDLQSSNNAEVTMNAKWVSPSIKLPKITKSGMTCHWTSPGISDYNSEGTYTPASSGGVTSRTFTAVCGSVRTISFDEPHSARDTYETTKVINDLKGFKKCTINSGTIECSIDSSNPKQVNISIKNVSSDNCYNGQSSCPEYGMSWDWKTDSCRSATINEDVNCYCNASTNSYSCSANLCPSGYTPEATIGGSTSCSGNCSQLAVENNGYMTCQFEYVCVGTPHCPSGYHMNDQHSFCTADTPYVCYPHSYTIEYYSD